MTLNGVMALILRYSPNSVAFRVHCVKVVTDTPKLSAIEMCQKLAFTFLAIYDLWRYSRMLPRTSEILLDHRVGTIISSGLRKLRAGSYWCRHSVENCVLSYEL